MGKGQAKAVIVWAAMLPPDLIVYRHKVLSTNSLAVTGVSGTPHAMPSVSAPQIHSHAQARTEPLATIEGASVVATFAICTALWLARKSTRRLRDIRSRPLGHSP
jgi:hypothetical protein